MILNLDNDININVLNMKTGKLLDQCNGLEFTVSVDDYRNILTKKDYSKITVIDNDGSTEYENMMLYGLYDDPENVLNNIITFTTQDSVLYKHELSDIFEFHTILTEYVDLAKRKEIPNTYNMKLQELKYKTHDSAELNKYAGYTMLSKEWIDLFANWIGDRTVLEIGAGTGALYSELKKRNVLIQAIDNRSWDRFGWANDELVWADDILEDDFLINHDKYSGFDLFILAYPILDNDFANNIINTLRENSKEMIYIGPTNHNYIGETFMENINIIDMSAELKNISDKYHYWTGHEFMASSLLYVK